MKSGMLYSPFMLKGFKCSYSRAFFYCDGGYIFSKKTGAIVDVVIESQVFSGNKG